jgi:hypothetical protein
LVNLFNFALVSERFVRVSDGLKRLSRFPVVLKCCLKIQKIKMTNEANIEIIKHGETLVSISVVMPVWSKIQDDGTIAVNIPLFGLKTFASDENDAIIAISEAIKCFCIASEKFGQGINAELKTLGWVSVNQNEEVSSFDFNVADDDIVFEQIMQTGEQFVEHNLSIAC